LNILIVEARYHPDVADALVDGATAALEKGGARFERLAVPGVLELPAAIAIAARSARPFDGYVALGCVTGPAHIADMYYVETMRGLMTLGAAGISLGSGIVLAGDEGAAHDMATRQDLGGDAARACLSLCTFAERQGYQR
jgi:6,7-dimethyl-8-ribityllumazine synthase